MLPYYHHFIGEALALDDNGNIECKLHSHVSPLQIYLILTVFLYHNADILWMLHSSCIRIIRRITKEQALVW